MNFFSHRKEQAVTVTTETIVRTIVIIFAAVMLVRFIGHIGHQLELFGVAAFLALALNPAVTAITEHLRIKRRILATGLAYLIVIAVLSGFAAVIVPSLVHQTTNFLHDVPGTISSFSNSQSHWGHYIQKYHLQGQIDHLSKTLSSKLGDAPSVLIDTAGRVGGVFISVLTIFVLTFMMLVEGPLWLKRAAILTPADKRDDYKELAHKMYSVITGYVNGQVLIAALAAFCASLALTIATHFTHTSVNILALAGIVFLFGLIPLIGNTLAAILVALICLFTSAPLAIIMIIYFPIYQQIENTTLQPHIQAKNNQLTPLLVFMAALVGAGFGGLLGAFVAIPAAGCLRILLEYRFGDQLAPTEQSVIDSDLK